MFTKDLEELKNKQTEMNSTLEGINRRTAGAEEQITDLEDQKEGGNHCHRIDYRKKNGKKKMKTA